MKKFKKLFAMLLTLAMVMGMSVTSFAETTKPSAGDSISAEVKNVEKTATVTAYRIIEPIYTENGVPGYQAVESLQETLGEEMNPEVTSDKITTISKLSADTLNALTNVPMSTTDTTDLATFTANLNPGYWMILVTGDVKEVYNPMLLGVWYSVSGSDSTVAMQPVDANSNWTLVTDGAYAKSTAPSVTKEIVTGQDADGKDVTAKGSSAAAGETVDFKITTAIPSYSKEYTSAIVKIEDTLTKGLKLNGNSIKVKIGTVDFSLPENANKIQDAYEVSPKVNQSGFVITIKSAYALAHGTEAVVVTYNATVDKDAADLNFVANDNTAKLIYTNNPGVTGDGGTTTTPSDETHTYTFAIGANLYGESSETWNKITEEVYKTGEVVKTENGTTTTTFERVGGAEFTLTKQVQNGEGTWVDTTDTKYIYSATTSNPVEGQENSGGHLTFTGLGEGKYLLRETKAPAGYSINTEPVEVNINAEYNPDGTLKDYTIQIGEDVTATYTATYKTENNVTTIEKIEATGPSYEFKNTKLQTLPSTGGIGTTIFTVGGCAIMILAAGLYFASRRKSAK